VSLRYLHRNSHTDTTTVRFRTVPNCVAKVKGEHDSRIGATVLECTDLAALTVKRPIERGYLVNTQQQRDIWMHTLTQVMRTSPRGSSLLLTEPVLNFPSVQSRTDQVRLCTAPRHTLRL